MKNLLFLSAFLFAFSLSSCGGGDSENQSEDSENVSQDGNKNEGESDNSSDNSEPANLQEAMDQVQKSMKDAGMQQKEPVNFRELQKMTPEKLDGMERVSKSGETAGALGMKISTSEAKYKDDDGNTIEVKIVDTGGFAMGLMGMAAWSAATIDKEDENGYERTSTLDGYKCFEKCRNRNNSCEISVIADNRYVVTASCNNCGMDKLKSTVKEMGLEDMADLKAEK